MELLSNPTVTELATLLIPIDGKNLILPNVSVAEILDYQSPESQEDGPTWYLGSLKWRTLTVPLVSFEAINDQPFFSQLETTKITIINGISNNAVLPFWGMLAQGSPRLMRVGAEEIIEDHSLSIGPGEVMAVNVNGEPARIPNLQWIEQQILELHR